MYDLFRQFIRDIFNNAFNFSPLSKILKGKYSPWIRSILLFLVSQATKRNLAQGYWHVEDTDFLRKRCTYFSNFRFNRNPLISYIDYIGISINLPLHANTCTFLSIATTINRANTSSRVREIDIHVGKRHESDADLFMQRSNARFMFRRSDTMQIYSVSWRLRDASLIEERFFPCRENEQAEKPDETRKPDTYPMRICR